jgi:acyl carrier protein
MKINAMTLTNGTLTVIVDNGAQILTARTDHPRWNDLLEAYKKRDDSAILSLISLKTVVEEYSVGALSVNSAGVTYNGRLIHSVDTERVMSFLREGLPYQPIANYMARKMLNPSARAISELYAFLEHKFMPITPEGMIIAYKGVLNNYYSKTGNLKTVVLQGIVNGEGQILNRIGDVIEIERSSCDDDFRNGCSFGLHAGSLSYATGWADRVILVEIDPKDVVSVPADCACQKLRCCKYKVIGEYTGPLPSHYTNEFSSSSDIDETYDSSIEDSDDYDEGCECEDCQNGSDDENETSSDYDGDCDLRNSSYIRHTNNDAESNLEKVTEPVSVDDDDVEARVISILSEQFGVNKETINPTTPMSTFNLDSLDIVELVIVLEYEFEIEIPDNDIEKFINENTVTDLVIYLKNKSNSTSSTITREEVSPIHWTNGYNDGLGDKTYPKYLPGDETSADSENHRQYIVGYLKGYSDKHLPTKEEG